MKTNLAAFKEYRPESYAKLQKMRSSVEYEYDCTMKMGKKHITIMIADPLNADTTKTYEFGYHTDVEAELNDFFKNISGIRRTIFKPHYLSLIPVIKGNFDGKAVELVCFDDEVRLCFNGLISETFGYDLTSYERCTTKISELLIAAKNPNQTHENPCQNKSHCGNCQNKSCRHSPDFTLGLWEAMTPDKQQNFLDSLNEEEKVVFLQKINRR